ncbi:uncharacterized protein DUF4062 [Nitrosospira sp. Nsp5]|uniref:DUF4062 domain-containing protein n=1 Tax=Nitrosospira multiformis TaxID=1231 RepID=A0ABY0T7Q3_9PROT|nr:MULTISPECIES: DUF4062 domain-containing protein [Nitrosospira]PTR07475.1 uncharacterized protein DUF4062 [Nitrosospira sp. Nsp5]SDQ40126.1 protein of unknown function [Nitrosospira multiformis]
MAKPRVFVSSTYYDLKHIRSSLDLFIESLGYESVLSEKGDIAYSPDHPLDDSCYREAGNADLFVLIIGGRYGSEASVESKKPPKTFFDRYDSITKKEYESAASKDIPIYILLEAGVYSEYQTFLRNKDNTGIRYAHVDSVNIFHLIEEILVRPRNNPLRAFERFSEIETWLRDQWAGMFRELLTKQSQQQQLAALTTEVGQLKEINETLKKYLEAVMTGAPADVSTKLIRSEEKRLEELKRLDLLRSSRWCEYAMREANISFGQFMEAMKRAESFKEFAELASGNDDRISDVILGTLMEYELARQHFNEARKILDLPPIRKRATDAKSGSTLRSTRTSRKRTDG